MTVRNSYFTVNLDAGGNDNTYGYPWVTMGSSLQNGGTVITCPDGYYGYQSDVYNKNSKLATMSVTIVGYTEFDIYIRSNAESSYDYVIIKTTIASSISTSGAIANTSGNQQSGTNISDYTKVTLTTGNGLTDDTKDLPRVLLVGDSICNGYQAAVRDRLKGKVNVSYWVSSYCVTSPAYLPLLSVYLDEAKYVRIYNNAKPHGARE